MLDIFSGLRLVIKHRPINIDNTIFRFHWFLTSTILISFSLIITARQYVGQPIECHSTDKIPETLLNSYCWVQSTFTVPQACNQRVGIDIPYPCIDNSRGREIKMFAYYQWVGIVLFIQGLLFHLPYYLWKIWEAGLIRAITTGLRVTVLSDIERCKKKEIVIEYLHKHMGHHKSYALRYFICELFCLLNLLLQMWATDKFFDGQFVNYGLDVIRYSSPAGESQQQHISNSNDQSNGNYNRHSDRVAQSYSHNQLMAISNNITAIEPRVDPMTFIFPRITKCSYYDFGSSGDIQKHDAICLLPLNIVNEKIYIALWFWFLILALLTLVVIVFRFFLLLSNRVRAKVLRSRCKLLLEDDLNIICQRGDIGDWFLFYMMANNVDPLIMREIVSEIAERLDEEIMSDKEAESLDSFSRIANRDSINSNLIERRIVKSADVITSNSASDSMSTFNGRTRQPTTTSSLGKKLRRRFNLKGFLKGGRLFSLDDISVAPTVSQRSRMKRLNSLQGDRQHLFSGQLRLDLEDGSSATFYLKRSKTKNTNGQNNKQLEIKQDASESVGQLAKSTELSPSSSRDIVDDTSAVNDDCLPLPRKEASGANNLTEIRHRNSERRIPSHMQQRQTAQTNTLSSLTSHLTSLDTINNSNGTLSLAPPPARQSNRSMTVVNMSS